MSETSVYLYYGVSGYPVYVGVTDRGTRRMHEHADDKPWWPLVIGCSIDHYAKRADALARETYLIKSYRPAFNFQHNPDRGLSAEEKVARCGGLPQLKVIPEPLTVPQVRHSIKERRRFFYTLTPEQRRVYPCVTCGTRPGNGRPQCTPCIQEDKAARAVIAASRTPHSLTTNK